MATSSDLSEILFDAEGLKLDPENDYFARIPPLLSSRSELLNALRDGLQLPSYFGENWDALSDCLRDLSWIEQRRVILQHEDVPQVSEEVLSVYLNVLIECVRDWRTSEEHELVVVFPPESRERIAGIASRFLLFQEQANAESKEWPAFSASQLAKQYVPEDAIYDEE